MAASSSTTPFSLDLYHSGYFKLKSLTYLDSEMVTMNIDVSGFKFEDMKEYLKHNTFRPLRAVKMHDGNSFPENKEPYYRALPALDNIILGVMTSLNGIARYNTKIKIKNNLGFKCSRARRISLYNLKQNVGSQYDRLVDYAGELRKTNPGTTVHLCIDPLADGACQGELLAAIGRDGNNQIYPIAWAVVQVESTESWEWFIKSLTKDLGLADGHGITFISDGHKGLIQAVRRVVPRVEHRLCARHIYANFNKVYSGVLFRNLFWQASKASYHQKFKSTMEEIKTASAGAYQYLVDKDPCTWSRAYFKEGMDCDAVENGLSE
ncbi:hypothetical protein Tco_1507280 [Tanacetum coccineum]